MNIANEMNENFQTLCLVRSGETARLQLFDHSIDRLNDISIWVLFGIGIASSLRNGNPVPVGHVVILSVRPDFVHPGARYGQRLPLQQSRKFLLCFAREVLTGNLTDHAMTRSSPGISRGIRDAHYKNGK